MARTFLLFLYLPFAAPASCTRHSFCVAMATQPPKTAWKLEVVSPPPHRDAVFPAADRTVAGRAILAQAPKDWKKRLTKLSTLDWSSSNTKLWEGRAMIGGRLSKSSSAVARAGNAVKIHLGTRLSSEEQAIENVNP